MNLPSWKKLIAPALAIVLAATILMIPAASIEERKITAFEAIPISYAAVKEVQGPPKVVEQEEKITSEVVEIVLEEITEELDWDIINIPPEPEEEIPALDRTKPLYNVYKSGIAVDVPIELQWYIRDMCDNYSFYEKYIYGMILAESTFKSTVSNSECIGLCQINTFWIKDAAITHFTNDYCDRDLKDPYDNLLTMAEMWCYARDTYGLDLMTEDGMMRVLYWHNSGNDPRHISKSNYANVCTNYANELVPLQ